MSIRDQIDRFKIARTVAGTRGAIVQTLTNEVLRARWIVSLEDGEMGLRIGGINLWYYKWTDPMISNSRAWREARKREFGETVKSLKHDEE